MCIRDRESPEKIVQDHVNAKRLAEACSGFEAFEIDLESVVTNIVIVEVVSENLTAADICERLSAQDIHAIPFGSMIRMVTHYDVSSDQIDKAITALEQIVA